ncbi:Nucleoside phosphorylase superfamily [Fusarium oxysporum f. sp. vasinfectum]|nr:Nucleoside phosphorylase superfamily [Fusarium oxysporum f. sp. vasinfectum]KAK2667767.1 Nucleoside phosphorylase superfamily [Fusarium oxysporum f. sp. vasinfectum]
MQPLRFQHLEALNPLPAILHTATGKVRGQYDLHGHQIGQSINAALDKKPRLRRKYGRPEPTTDRLYLPEVLHQPNEPSCVLCGEDPSALITRPERTSDGFNPSMHYGLIASSNQPMRDALQRDELAKRGVICFDTDLMSAFPSLVIRGICDYADTHHNDRWHGYAAMVAAACAKDVLGQIDPNMVEAEMRIGLADLRRDATTLRGGSWGTGEWFLDSPQFLKWRDSPNQTLFCPGNPGAGKTIITSIIIDHLEKLFSNDKSVGIAYVYCDFRRQDEQTAKELLMNLLKQLLHRLPTLPESVESLHSKHKTKGSRPPLEEILTALLSLTKLFSRVFVLVDALDECRVTDDTRSRFLGGVFELQATSKINILATSRPIAEILGNFENKMSLEIRAADKDIRLFVTCNISYLPSFIRGNGLGEMVENKIADSATGEYAVKLPRFLLARFHFDSLRDKYSVAQVNKALAKLPSGSDAYDRVYDMAMDIIKRQYRPVLAERVLSVIACAKRPLKVGELQDALADELNGDEWMGNVTDLCAGLVTIDSGEGIIRVLHHTTQEYFERTRPNWFLEPRSDITMASVTCLNS